MTKKGYIKVGEQQIRMRQPIACSEKCLAIKDDRVHQEPIDENIIIKHLKEVNHIWKFLPPFHETDGKEIGLNEPSERGFYDMRIYADPLNLPRHPKAGSHIVYISF